MVLESEQSPRLSNELGIGPMGDSPRYDITIVVTAHREGTLAHRTMRSVRAAIDVAACRGYTCEVIVILDAADDETREYFSGLDWEHLRRFETDFRDPGPARNLGVQEARGRFVAFLDADDLIGRRWLERAADRLTEQSHPAIAVPKFTGVFEGEWSCSDHLGSEDADFELASLVDRNHWVMILMIEREVALQLPFSDTPTHSGLGFEDWHWYCGALAADVKIIKVDEGCTFVRRKHRQSRLAAHVASDVLLPPSPLFTPHRFAERLAAKAYDKTLGTGPQGEAEKVGRPARSTFASLEARSWRAIYSAGTSAVRKMPFLMPLASLVYRSIRNVEQRRNAECQISDWLRAEWEEIHRIEPQLLPDESFARMRRLNWKSASPLGEAYTRLCQQIPREYSHVLLVPWLKRGGADLEVLNYVEALLRDGAAKGVLVLGTEDTDSPWAERLPSQAIFVNFGAIAGSLKSEQQEALLGFLLVQLSPHAVHNLNSRLGYHVFRRFGLALSKLTRLYASIFCEDFDEQGHAVGYSVVELPQCVEYLTAVLADNQRVLDRIHDLFAIPAEKLFVHYQPVESEFSPPRPRREEGRLHVLWAARLDRQKRPDILLQVARRCQDLPFHFHVFGSALLDGKKTRTTFRGLSNVTYEGPFDGFESLNAPNYDVFLNTSQWEGLPNALLDALVRGMPVVTSDVGGIAELIKHTETGMLVTPFDDVQQYVTALRALHEDWLLAQRIAKQGQALVKRRHSCQAFTEAVCAVPGYAIAPRTRLLRASA